MWIFKLSLHCSWCLHSSVMWLHATRQLMSIILRHHSGLICKGPQRINCFFDIPTLEKDTTVLSQNVIASKSIPHPRIKTSFSLKFLCSIYQITTSPASPIPLNCTWPLSQPVNIPACCSYSLTNCSAQLPLALYSNQPLYTYNKTPLLPCSSFLLKSSEPNDGSSKFLWNARNYLAYHMVPYTCTLSNRYVKLYVNMQVVHI
jgi:hypothetical protein